MNIFNSLRVYAGKWSEKSSRKFDKEEIEATQQAKVVESQYGYSVAFFMKAGGQVFIPLDQNSTLSPGDIVDLNKAQIVTLQRPGEKDIYRVRI